MSTEETIRIACVLKAGPDRTISIGCKLYRFEMHPLGPGFLTKNGNVIDNNRIPKSVWQAVRLWAEQGQRLDPETGHCIWNHEPKDILKHLGGKHYLLVGTEPGARGE